MSQPTDSPFVKLAVGALRCLNPDLHTEHGEAGVRAALDLWSWRRELSDDDVEQVIVTLENVVAILRKQPTGEYEREAPLPSAPRGVRYSEDPDGLHPDSGQGDAGSGLYATGGELA